MAETTAVDTPLDASEPSSDNGSSQRCSRCAFEGPAKASQCGRCGRFLPGNTAAVTHGLNRYQATGALPPDLRQPVDDFREALVVAQGGLEELDREPLRAGLCRLLVDAEVGRQLLVNEVLRAGVNTKPGRAAYDRLLATMDRWHRIATTLGLSRRARHVNFSERLVAAFAAKSERDGRAESEERTP